MAIIEHGDAVETDHTGGTKGIHVLQGFPDVTNEAARDAIVIAAGDVGRVIRQSAGTSPGFYVARAAGTGVEFWDGPIGLANKNNATDATDLLQLARTFVGAGDGLQITMAAATTGNGIFIDHNQTAVGSAINIDVDAAATTSDGINVTHNGSGGSAIVAGNGTAEMLTINADGTILIDGNSDGNVQVTAEGSGTAALATLGTGDVSMVAAGAGDAIVNAAAGGDVRLQEGGADRLVIAAAGSVTVTPLAGQAFEVVGALFQFGATVVAPVITQADDATAGGITADTLLMRAQASTDGVSGTGGAFDGRSGTGTTSDGEVFLRRGATTVFQSSGADTIVVAGTSGNIFLRTTGNVRATLNANEFQLAVGRMEFAPSVANPIIRHEVDTAADATGGLFTQSAQAVSGVGTAIVGGAYLAAGGASSGAATTGTGGGATFRGGDAAGATTDIGGACLVRPGAGDTGGVLTIANGAGAARFTVDDGGSSFFGASTVGQGADPGALTDSTGGSANSTLVAVPVVNGSGATTAQEAAINDNFADVIAKINALRALLSATGGGNGIAA